MGCGCKGKKAQPTPAVVSPEKKVSESSKIRDAELLNKIKEKLLRTASH